jgi:hypothetical protein
MSVDSGSSAWSSGSGIAAGVVVMALVILELPPLVAGRTTATPARAWLVAALGTAVLGFTIAAFTTASVDVSTPMTAVHIEGRLWPAYAGLVLAALIALGGLVEFAGRFPEGEDWRRGSTG